MAKKKVPYVDWCSVYCMRNSRMVQSVAMTDTDVENDTLKVYEVGYHLAPTTKEEELEGTVGEIRASIQKMGGSFIAESAPMLVRLTYSIKVKSDGKRVEYDRGYFGWIKFEASPHSVRTLTHELDVNARIIRFSVHKTIREDTRAKIKMPLREIKRTDTLKVSPRREVSASVPVSEEDLDKAIQGITTE